MTSLALHAAIGTIHNIHKPFEQQTHSISISIYAYFPIPPHTHIYINTFEAALGALVLFFDAGAAAAADDDEDLDGLGFLAYI